MPKSLIPLEEQEAFAVARTRGAELQEAELHKINEPFKLEFIGVVRSDPAKFYKRKMEIPFEQLDSRQEMLTRYRHAQDESKRRF